MLVCELQAPARHPQTQSGEKRLARKNGPRDLQPSHTKCHNGPIQQKRGGYSDLNPKHGETNIFLVINLILQAKTLKMDLTEFAYLSVIFIVKVMTILPKFVT